jgi:hypothetical protein
VEVVVRKRPLIRAEQLATMAALPPLMRRSVDVTVPRM